MILIIIVRHVVKVVIVLVKITNIDNSIIEKNHDSNVFVCDSKIRVVQPMEEINIFLKVFLNQIFGNFLFLIYLSFLVTSLPATPSSDINKSR